MIRAFLIPVWFAADTFGDLADRAAAATVGTRKGVAYLTNAGALRA